MLHTGKPIEVMLAAIQSLDLESVKVRIMDPKLGEGWNGEYANSIERSYKTYLSMLVKHPEDAEDILLSKDVDEFWHTHILQTLKYHEDCEAVFGKYLHHEPHVGEVTADDLARREAQAEITRRLYQAEFGPGREHETAWAGDVVTAEKAAYSGMKLQAENAAYSGTTLQARNAAYSGMALQAQNAAYSGTTLRAGNAAYSGTSVRAERAAYSGTRVRAESAAYSGMKIASENAAYSGTSVKAENAAYSGTKVTSENAAYSGVTSESESKRTGARAAS